MKNNNLLLLGIAGIILYLATRDQGSTLPPLDVPPQPENYNDPVPQVSGRRRGRVFKPIYA